MISETNFVSNYSSLWHTLAPDSESVIKRLNKSVLKLSRVGTVWSRPERRAFINEIAFHMFILSIDPDRPQGLNYSEILPLSIAEARRRQAKFGSVDNDVIQEPSPLEMAEAYGLFRRLRSFKSRIHPSANGIYVAPGFKGCGILDSCQADLIFGDMLIEIKAGDRNFRSTDVRQILTYCALNAAEGAYRLRRFALVNPRRAFYFVGDIETICLQCASKPPAELLSEILYFLSNGELSR